MRDEQILKESEFRISNKLFFLIILGAVIIHNLIYGLSYKSSFPYDDAYIAYRYSDNIANGDGWTYNKGEVTSGTTSYLNTGLIAAVCYISKTSAGLIGRILPIIFSSFLLIFSTLVFLKHFKLKEYAILYLLLFIISPTIYNIGLSGMETSFFLATIFLAILLIQTKHYYISAILTGLLLFIRLDALIFVLVYVLYVFVSSDINLKKKILVLLVLFISIGSYFIFNFIMFNSWVPLSLYSKSVAFKDLDIFQNRTSIIYGFFRARLLFVLLPLSIVGVFTILKSRDINIFHLALFPFFWISAYVVYKPWMRDWYYFIPYPFLLFLSIIGIIRLGEMVVFLKRYNKGARKYLQIFLIVGFIFVLSVSFLRQYNESFGCSKNTSFNQSVIKTAEFLEGQESIKSRSLFLGDIGYIGFITKAKVIDYMGLVYPKSVRYLKEKTQYSNGRNLSWTKLVEFIADEQPDYLVFSSGYVFYQKLRGDVYILQNYTKATTKVTFDIWAKNSRIQ